MTIETVIKSVCENCKFYNKSFGVCRGEVLPVERAILSNAEGKGLCDNVKNFITNYIKQQPCNDCISRQEVEQKVPTEGSEIKSKSFND